MNRAFPFPGRAAARDELRRDPCFHKIPPAQVEGALDLAWRRGAGAARALLEKYPDLRDFRDIAPEENLRVLRLEKDYVLGGTRYFSDYLSGTRTIRLYTKSIALWAAENGLGQREAENLVLAHEFFHHLECTGLGLTSRLVTVPMVRLFGHGFGKTGVRALSEIGAHAFARTYFEETIRDGGPHRPQIKAESSM